MKTYKQVVDLFESAANNHIAIKAFDEGSLDYLDARSQNTKYPYVFLRPVASPGLVQDFNGVSGQRSLTFELFALDVPALSNQSPRQIKSNTEIYIYDLISYFNNGPTQRTDYVVLQGLLPVDEAFNDRAYGWVGTITYTDEAVSNYCTYPQL